MSGASGQRGHPHLEDERRGERAGGGVCTRCSDLTERDFKTRLQVSD